MLIQGIFYTLNGYIYKNIGEQRYSKLKIAIRKLSCHMWNASARVDASDIEPPVGAKIWYQTTPKGEASSIKKDFLLIIKIPMNNISKSKIDNI